MDKKNKIIVPLLFILILFIYFLTLAPSVTFEDSGEFITSASTLSIAHPPGYPLYLILGKLFSFLPFGTNEFNINFMSAFFSALSAVVLYMLLYRIFRTLKERHNHFISLFIILFYFFSSTLWDTSVVAEVYTLNLFLTALLLFLINLIFFETPAVQGTSSPYKKIKYHYLFFYLLGLSFGNHQTVFFIVLIYFLLFIKNKTFQRLKKIHYIKFIFLIFLGISIYAYLPVRAGSSPVINWGNPKNYKNFRDVLFRQQYGALGSGAITSGSFFKQSRTINPIYEFYKQTNTQIDFNHIPTVIILGIILYLLYYGFKKIQNKNIKLLFVLLFLLYTFFLIFITNTPEDKLFTLKVFFIPAWFSFYSILFYGLFKMLKKYSYYLFPVLFIALFFFNFPLQNKKNYFYTHDYALNILKNLTYRSVLFTLKDNETFPIWDMKYIRHKRPDIAVINLVILSEQWYLNQITANFPDLKINLAYLKGTYKKDFIRETFLKSIIDSNPDREIYFTTKKFGKFLDIKMELYSSGILYKLNKTPSRSQAYVYEFKNLKNDFANFLAHFNKNKIEKFKTKLIHLDTQTKYVLQAIAFSFLEYANNQLLSSPAGETAYLYKYSIYLNKIIGAAINNIYAYINIGNIFLQKKDKDLAIYFYKKGIELQPKSKLAKETALKINNMLNEGIASSVNLPQTAENYYNKGDYINAMKYYKKMLEVVKDNPVIYGHIGDCYFNLENYKEAINYYRQAIKVRIDYANAYYNLGGCYIVLKDRAKAKKIWETGLKYSPGDRKLLNALKKH